MSGEWQWLKQKSWQDTESWILFLTFSFCGSTLKSFPRHKRGADVAYRTAFSKKNPQGILNKGLGELPNSNRKIAAARSAVFAEGKNCESSKLLGRVNINPIPADI